MQISVGEKPSHLPKKSVQKFVDFFAGGIERRFKDSGLAFNRIWTRRTAELGMPHKPTGRMAGKVKLRHDANAAVTCVGDDLSHLILGVEVTIRAKLVEAREL